MLTTGERFDIQVFAVMLTTGERFDIQAFCCHVDYR